MSHVTNIVPENLLQELVERFRSRIQSLSDKPEETIEAVVRALWLTSAGVPVSAVKAMQLPLLVLEEGQKIRLLELLEERSRGVPLAHLTSRQDFMGLELVSSPHALIPRKETEILGSTVRDLFREQILPHNPRPQWLDLCTGSGNLACLLARELPLGKGFAVDLSAGAVDLARTNLGRHEVEDRVTLFVGDLFSPFQAADFLHSFDLIVCNPPYITSARVGSLSPEIIGYEPKMAFDAGALGLSVLWRLLEESPRFLKPGGWLAFEVGLGQGPALLRRLANNPLFESVQGVSDNSGNVRAILGRLKFDIPV